MWSIEKGSVYVINLGELEDKIWSYCTEYKKKYGNNWEETHPEKIDDLIKSVIYDIDPTMLNTDRILIEIGNYYPEFDEKVYRPWLINNYDKWLVIEVPSSEIHNYLKDLYFKNMKKES